MPRPQAACGTYPAYRRHLRNCEEVDAACRAAQVAYAEGQKESRGSDVVVGPLASHALGSRGIAYRDSFIGDAADVPAAKQQLVVEGARMADRLEKMNDIIAGKGVVELLQFRLKQPMDEQGLVTVEMSIDNIMGEARQLQAAFERLTKTLIADFHLESSSKGADPFDAFLAGGNVIGISTAPSRKQA